MSKKIEAARKFLVRAGASGLRCALLAFACGFAAFNSSAVDLRLNDSNPLQMPAVGSYGLRILSPTLLEVTYITAKQPDPAVLTEWNFVDANFNLTAPAPSQFAVTANGQAVAVQTVGFKRRPIYAPLNVRDLRLGNYLYLQLATPIADGQTVVVTNPGGALWSSAKQFSTVCDPLRLSPAIHVNQEGYMPAFSKKAMVGYYLGNLGEMNVAASLGFKIVTPSGTVVYQGSLTPRRDVGYTFSPLPYQQVLEANFTAFTTPGEYRLQVPGLGASFSFLIDEGIGAAFARTYALGLFHQRCGFANNLPYTRHDKGDCHTNLVLVPDMTFTAVNSELASMSSDFAGSQAAGTPQLKDIASSLFPFVNRNPINLRGGHHDAGDYSKYTINIAQLAHALVFAVDAFPGVAALDNLGLPESGDGTSDVLQEAKWELDFLANMQDADGGFYFLVYPRNREYEDNVSLRGTDLGDQQVVFPKTTSVTAAAAAALAQAASSPAFKRAYPAEAALYLAKAKLAWQFLQAAWLRYGRAGAYQKITHYGNEFQDKDEIAWLACELYLATGDVAYQSDLLANFDPSDPNTLRWGWWRMFEGYGCAIRSYAFAARTGRLPQGALDATFLAKCENQIRLAGDDQTRFSQEMAYGSSFPDPNKPYRSAGWYFSVDQTFDMATAYQINPQQSYLDAIIANMNFEAGCNPNNVAFLTGIGWKRQRETVNQYAENDRRVLPPSGIPIGNIQQGMPYIYAYKSELTALCFPNDGATTAPFAPYDKWCDTFNTSTEMVNPQQAHSLASMSFIMALTSVRTQAWKFAVGQITGLPASVPAHSNITANLTVAGLDLSKARFVWETTDRDPDVASTLNFSAANTGPQWVEVEAMLPDGRRVFVATNYLATFPLDTPPNSYLSSEVSASSDVVALYHLNSNGADATSRQPSLTLQGNATFDTGNVGWMATRAGASLHVLDLGDKAVVSIPNAAISSNATSVAIEAMIYINEFKAYNRANALLVSLRKNDWNALLELDEDMYAGAVVRGGGQWSVAASTLASTLTTKQWHHLRIAVDATGYTLKIDGNVVASLASAEFANWAGSGTATVELGNFDGWIDEVVIRNGTAPGAPSTVATPTISPNGGNFNGPIAATLATSTTGATIRYTTDGSTPTANSAVYVSTLTVSSSSTLKAQAFKSGMTDSAVTTGVFTISSTNAPPATTNATAVFVKTDSTTSGNWSGVYGADGFNIIGNYSSYPSYAQVSASGKSDYTWADPTADARALKKFSSTDHIAATWYSATSFTVNVNVTDGRTHRVALYVLDWDNSGRAQTIDVLDAASGTLLNSQSVSGFSGGKYLVWTVSGNVNIRFTRNAGFNAVVMGLFFDPVPSQISLQSSVPLQTTPGQFQLRLAGTPGQSFVIQATTDLVHWTSISTNTLSGAAFDFTDPNAGSFKMRFYRAAPLNNF
jgi:hypothetical protein